MLNRVIDRVAKNREIRVRVAKTEEPVDEFVPIREAVQGMDPEQIARLVKEVVQYTAVTVGVVVGGIIVLRTISKIVIKHV